MTALRRFLGALRRPTAAQKHRRVLLAVYGSFLAALVVLGFLVNRAFTVSTARQVAACERGNALRKENNERVPALQLQRAVLEAFIRDATAARAASAKAADHATARKYAALSVKLERVEYHAIPLVDCPAAVAATK